MKKRSTCILLVITLLFTMIASVMPAYATEVATEPVTSIEFVSEIIVYDFETGTREDGEGNEYTVYDWFVYGRSNVIVNNEFYGYENQSFSGSPMDIFMRCFSRGIVGLNAIDTQPTAPWEVGNTYDAQIYYSYYLDNDELYEDTIDVKVKVTEVPVSTDFEITSEITVTDENVYFDYDNGCLCFETTHFSKYIVLENETCDDGHTDENGDFVCDTCEKLTADVNNDGILNIDDLNTVLVALATM